MNVLRSITKLAINRFGYDVRRFVRPETVHVSGPGVDPITFEYLPDRRGHAILDIRTADLRGFHSLGLPLHSDRHPFVRAIAIARTARDEAAARESIERVLQSYYASVQPASVADVLGLSADAGDKWGPQSNRAEHPIEAALPWSPKSPGELRHGRGRAASFEGLQNGLITGLEDGITAFGPVTSTKLKLEVTRLHTLLKSVEANGFTRFDPRSPLKVAALRRGKEYRWLIASGQHRFAAAAAFGIDQLPAMVIEVIRRDDAEFWPQVVAGIFTEGGATAVFDRIFDGNPVDSCRAWMDRHPGGGPV